MHKNVKSDASFLKLPPKKGRASEDTPQASVLKIGERTLGTILEKAQLPASSSLALGVAEEIRSPEEYDGKVRVGALLFIGETVLRQAHDSTYSEYLIKDFKPDDLLKLLTAMLKHDIVGITWDKREKRFSFYVLEAPAFRDEK